MFVTCPHVRKVVWREANIDGSRQLLHQLGRELGDVLALELGTGQLELGGHAAAVGVGDGAGAVGTASVRNLNAHRGEPGEGSGQASDDHSVVQHEGVQGAEGHLVPVVLGGGRDDGAANLPDEGAVSPLSAGLVEDALHLGGNRPEAGGAAQDDAVVVLEVAGLYKGNIGECLWGLDGIHHLQNLEREGLGDALEIDDSTTGLGTLRGGAGHLEHVTVHAVENNGDLGCHY